MSELAAKIEQSEKNLQHFFNKPFQSLSLNDMAILQQEVAFLIDTLKRPNSLE